MKQNSVAKKKYIFNLPEDKKYTQVQAWKTCTFATFAFSFITRRMSIVLGELAVLTFVFHSSVIFSVNFYLLCTFHTWGMCSCRLLCMRVFIRTHIPSTLIPETPIILENILFELIMQLIIPQLERLQPPNATQFV